MTPCVCLEGGGLIRVGTRVKTLNESRDTGGEFETGLKNRKKGGVSSFVCVCVIFFPPKC